MPFLIWIEIEILTVRHIKIWPQQQCDKCQYHHVSMNDLLCKTYFSGAQIGITSIKVKLAHALPLWSTFCDSRIVFTRGQFCPSGIVIAPVCVSVSVSVCVCINHLLVRTITHQPFKLESPNLTHKCKTPWLRSLLFWGVIDLELQGQI